MNQSTYSLQAGTNRVQWFDPYGDRSRLLMLGIGMCLVIAGIATAGAFLTDPTDAAPDPVQYDDVIEVGLSSETDELMAGDTTIPRAQTFYSGFQYVVGYNGITTLIEALADDRTETQFGYPIAVYVQSFDGTGPTVTDRELFTADGEPAWTPAADAVYVVDSDARTPAGETVIPFTTQVAAETFVDDYGGTILDWNGVRHRTFDVDSAAVVRSMAPDRAATTADRLANADHRADRPVSVVVGEDAPTIGAAIDAAPANTTVLVPPGEYAESFTVSKPLTIRGAGGTDSTMPIQGANDTDSTMPNQGAHGTDSTTTIRGNGTGSVITVRAPEVALEAIHVSGTGTQTRDEDAVQGPSTRAADESGGETPGDSTAGTGDTDVAAWDTNVQLGYGHGDAGIRAIDAPGLVVSNVHVETNASGLLLRTGSHATITGLRVDGSDEWQDGFMGIVGIESAVTVTESTFVGGRDGVYLHRADGSAVVNSTFIDNRYGIHLMYTGDALIADNHVQNGLFGGITVMTRPEGNAIVGNHVHNSSAGIQASGTRTYVGYNTLTQNGLGLSTSSRGSLYEHNVIVGNDEGARATTVVPSSRVVANDFVGNERHAGAGAGPLRIWADGDVGNYWAGADARVRDDAYRGYRPTAPVDAAFHRDLAAVTLAESPAVTVLDRLTGSAAGTRTGGIFDPVPAPSPFAPDRVSAATESPDEPIHAPWIAALNQTAPTNQSSATDNA